MSHKIRFTEPAKHDLEEIYLYIAEDTVAAADKHRDQLIKRCMGLVDHPRIGTLRDDIRPGLRSVTEGDYVIFYRILNEADLAVMRVGMASAILPSSPSPINRHHMRLDWRTKFRSMSWLLSSTWFQTQKGSRLPLGSWISLQKLFLRSATCCSMQSVRLAPPLDIPVRLC